MSSRTQDIVVTDRCGAYTTNRVQGTSGSSTSGDEWAALSLAKKLFGDDLLRIEKLGRDISRAGGLRRTHWRAHAKPAAAQAEEYSPAIPVRHQPETVWSAGHVDEGRPVTGFPFDITPQ